MKTVGEVLSAKGAVVVTTTPDVTVLESVRSMVGHGVGCVVVLGPDGRIAGIMTERDVLRAVAGRFESLGTAQVADLMTRDVLFAVPGDSLDSVMALMTERRIRHLPILEAGRMIGLVSVGDVVKARMKTTEAEIRHLENYLSGNYPG